MPVVWTLTLIVGVLGAFENPARRGLVTELVEPADISNATSLNTAVMTGSRIFGPALAAFLIDSMGYTFGFLACLCVCIYSQCASSDRRVSQQLAVRFYFHSA